MPPEQAAQRSASPDEALCRRFMDLKNGHDRRANDLLGPRPQVPDRPVPADEADRLDAGLMLHQDVVILDVHPDRGGGESAGRYVFVLDGSVASERLAVRTTGGIEQRQRAMWRPDVVVEVRDGTIHPLYPRLHVD